MKKKHSRFLFYDLERFLTFNHISATPQRQLTFGYLSYIVVGVILLSLPFSTRLYVPLVDNLFSVTSAVSTTGLCTVSVAESYTFFGQLVLLLMIQLGGLGYMTLSSFVLYRLTHHFMRIKNGVMRTSFSMPKNVELHTLLNGIVIFTLIFESLGAVGLYISFREVGVDGALWSAIFHSVSSFCTAGFSLYNDSFEQFRSNVPVNIIVAVLSYAGAMGFIVMHDLWMKIRNIHYKITFTTKIIVVITIILSAIGTFQLMFFEPILFQYSIGERFMISLFQTMSAMTTVGFNTVPLGSISTFSGLILVMIMYIGSSPSGTGGGMKSTTASAVFAFVVSKLGMERDVHLFGHRLPSHRVDSALTTFVFYTSLLFLGVTLLVITDPTYSLSELLFEASSALGTVGLSMGITGSLSSCSKIILVCLMYIGRVGVLTFGTAMLMRLERKQQNEVKEEDDIAV